MQMITRTIQQEIEKWLFKQKVIIIYGARQVGKTTLVKSLIRGKENDSLYLNCDEPDIRDALSNKTSTHLKELAGNNKIIVIDEAQRVTNIGIALKLLVDNFSEIQVIATGSSSFDLSNHVKEPLTGRKIEFTLYPLSVE
jgi:predicted AAA+ superfamily ATPase